MRSSSTSPACSTVSRASSCCARCPPRLNSAWRARPSTRDKNRAPDREPDLVVEYETREDQGAIYRLSGDRVPLHIDPEFAKKAGYDKPFMHGLCSYGFVGRAVLHSLCDGDPERFVSLEGRFAERVEFGDRILTKIWRTGDGEALLQAETQDGKIALSQARATFRPA